MRIKYILRWLFIGITATAAFSYVGGLLNDWRRWLVISPVTLLAPPYLHNGDHVAETVLHAGEPVFVHVTTRRFVPCFASFSQRIISFRNGDRQQPVVWHDDPQTRGWTGAGTFESDYHSVTPGDLPPGHYFYERTAIFDCEDVGSLRQALPLIPFEMTNK